jgi:hypothetical protein
LRFNQPAFKQAAATTVKVGRSQPSSLAAIEGLIAPHRRVSQVRADWERLILYGLSIAPAMRRQAPPSFHIISKASI